MMILLQTSLGSLPIISSHILKPPTSARGFHGHASFATERLGWLGVAEVPTNPISTCNIPFYSLKYELFKRKEKKNKKNCATALKSAYSLLRTVSHARSAPCT